MSWHFAGPRLAGRDASRQCTSSRKPDDWPYPVAFTGGPTPQFTPWPRAVSPRQSGRVDFPHPDFPWGNTFALGWHLSLGSKRMRPHGIRSRRFPKRTCPMPFHARFRPNRFRHRMQAPRAGNFRQRVSAAQAGANSISSFQRWQATSRPSSVASAGS